MNAILLETGFLQRLRAGAGLWDRVGWIYGTSAGALAGTMAATDRLDELEEFLIGLATGRGVPPARALAAAAHGLARLHAPRDDRGACGSARGACARAGHRTDRAGRLRHRGRRPSTWKATSTPSSASTRHVARRPRRWEPQWWRRRRSARSSCRSASVRRSAPTAAGCATSRSRTPTTTLRCGEIVAFRHVSRHPRPRGENLARFRRRLEPFRAVPPGAGADGRAAGVGGAARPGRAGPPPGDARPADARGDRAGTPLSRSARPPRRTSPCRSSRRYATTSSSSRAVTQRRGGDARLHARSQIASPPRGSRSGTTGGCH